ncbi:MAG TPA: hypothetical protein DCR93_01615 [Cytophagales bacterium]|nr:hypothetical protein [Cytophagales bacterium]HAP58250.1 hypothetical protein [Cytophagales bacterium]
MFFPRSAQAQLLQEDLFGKWLIASSERKDGSTLIDYPPEEGTLPERWYIDRREICTLKTKAGKFGCTEYEFFGAGRRIKLETDLEYDVDYLHGDTLVVSQIDTSLPDEYLNRFLLVRNGIWQPDMPPVWEDEIAYFEHYGPSLKSIRLQNVLSKLKDSGWAEYKVVLDFAADTMSVTLLRHNFGNPKSEKILTRFLQKTFKDWSFQGEVEYPRVSQYLTVQLNPGGRMPINIWLKNWEQIRDGRQRDQDIRRARIYFQQGLVQLNRDQLDSALTLFTEAYVLDSVMINAVYNRAVVYVRQGNMDKACEDWQHLAQRGQVPARDRWREDCR